MSKIFIKLICSKFTVKPEDVLRLLAERDIIWAIVPNVTLSNDMLEMEFDAIDLPISEEVALCIAINGIWEGDRITVRHLDEQRVVISQATFKEKISLTSDSLFVRDDDYSRIEPLISEIANQVLEHEPLSQNEPVPSKSGKQLILRKLWEQKPLQKACDDMRVAGFGDDAITYALRHWRGITNMTEIGTILRGKEITESGREKHARKVLKTAGERYYTES
jgi:hypothetical protein